MENPVVDAIVISLWVGAAFGGWLLWPAFTQWMAATVKPFLMKRSDQQSRYVEPEDPHHPEHEPFPASGSLEKELQAEKDQAEQATDKVVIDREKLDKLLAQERERGMAQAFGLLQGGGYLDSIVRERRLTEAKQFVFDGVSGRRMADRINPTIRASETEGQARRPSPPQPLRTITVGDDHEVVL